MKPKQIIRALACGALLLAGGQAFAGQYSLQKIWDLQYVHLPDGTHRMAFKACSSTNVCWWWTPSTSSGAADSVRSLATAAFLSGKQVNVQCGFNGTGCPCQTAMVFESNVLSSKCLYNVEGLQVIE